jgi:hypothetical protein
MRWITVGPADQPGTSIVLSPPAVDPGLTDDERRTIVELAGRSDRDDAERDGQASEPVHGGGAPTTSGSLASSVLATVRPLPSPEVKRLGLVSRTEVLRNG